MTEPYFNMSAHGTGLEGFLNYANELVDGWLANGFLFFIFVVTVYVLSKSEWEMPGIFAFAFFLCLIISIIMKLFMAVSELVIFIIIIGMAGSLVWALVTRK